jgi:hypothetical protein
MAQLLVVEDDQTIGKQLAGAAKLHAAPRGHATHEALAAPGDAVMAGTDLRDLNIVTYREAVDEDRIRARPPTAGLQGSAAGRG